MERILLLALAVLSVFHSTNGACDFPSTFTSDKWFVSYTQSSGTEQKIRTYTSESIFEGTLGSNEQSESYDCLSIIMEPSFFLDDSRFFYISEMGPGNTVKCNRDFLEYTGNILTHGEIEVGRNVDATACSEMDFNSVTKQIFIKSSIVADTTSMPGTCPFTADNYQTSYIDQQNTAHCVGDLSSVSPINSHLTMNSCATNAPFDYYNPVNNRDIQCLTLMTGEFIDSTDVPVLILASPQIDNPDRIDIYCARYTSAFSVIQMSINAESDLAVFCHEGVTPTTAGGNNIAFTFDNSLDITPPPTLSTSTPSSTPSTPVPTTPSTPTTIGVSTSSISSSTITTPLSTSSVSTLSTTGVSTSTVSTPISTSPSSTSQTSPSTSVVDTTLVEMTTPGSPASYADIDQHVQLCFQNNYQTYIGSTTDLAAYSNHLAEQFALILGVTMDRITNAHIQKGPVNDNIVFTMDLAADSSEAAPEVGKIIRDLAEIMGDPDTEVYGLNGEALELCGSSDLYYWADNSQCKARKCGTWPTSNMTWQEAGGRCWILQGIYQCECTNKFSGDFCLTPISDSISQRTIIVIIVVIVIAVILITLICVFLCARYLGNGDEEDDIYIIDEDEEGDSTLKSVYSTLSRGKATAYNDRSFQGDPVTMETLSLGKGSRATPFDWLHAVNAKIRIVKSRESVQMSVMDHGAAADMY
ncbi:hypothetical protein CAPTEDRAFT_226016 [Capitella teleta]|uniref:EGF-like domain-containing protein n=1 Tax=Capitella teleta TaxID=283909 RepID=R7VLG8_CAPTE|nr:hypothetical protein CAPTEDRAFT_226016 [Capitella teleta]|eukprot:ELU17615.1 hypothetical protein CAPTEDRAFT_226016 [Capitella teleta]